MTRRVQCVAHQGTVDLFRWWSVHVREEWKVPLLYTVFVCDIISRLDRVDIGEDRVYLAGKEFRALQLADDLALIARSPEALQKLIDE